MDVGLLFSTDAALAGHEFVQLADDRDLEPAENVVPVLRSEVETRFGSRAIDALDAVSSTLTTSALRRMNAAVADGTPTASVAALWLTEHPGSG